MHYEIEKKYLIKEIPENLENLPKEEITQFYTRDENDKSQRFRKTTSYKNNRKTTKYYKTHKKWKWLVREETETTITEQEYIINFNYISSEKHPNIINKTRYHIPYKINKHIFDIELNKFHWESEWFNMAEIEFSSIQESQTFTPPTRFDLEVTDYKEANNSYISRHWVAPLLKKTQTEHIKIKEDLKFFYNNQSEKYTKTRKKYRSDWDMILQEIQNTQTKQINILEIWCWSGRLLETLNNISNIKINYTGVDLSEELIKQAQKIENNKNIKTQFICRDINQYLPTIKQEYYDYIIWIASIQHLPNKKERFFCIKNCYRILKYDWVIITTNRWFSRRMIQTHWRAIIKSTRKYILSILNISNKSKRNDLMIPRNDNNKIFYRFYHIFTLWELKELAIRSWFIIKKLCYLNWSWQEIIDWKESKNSLLIAKKSIFTE